MIGGRGVTRARLRGRTERWPHCSSGDRGSAAPTFSTLFTDAATRRADLPRERHLHRGRRRLGAAHGPLKISSRRTANLPRGRRRWHRPAPVAATGDAARGGGGLRGSRHPHGGLRLHHGHRRAERRPSTRPSPTTPCARRSARRAPLRARLGGGVGGAAAARAIGDSSGARRRLHHGHRRQDLSEQASTSSSSTTSSSPRTPPPRRMPASRRARSRSTRPTTRTAPRSSHSPSAATRRARAPTAVLGAGSGAR